MSSVYWPYVGSYALTVMPVTHAQESCTRNLYSWTCTGLLSVCHAFFYKFLAPNRMQLYLVQVCTRTCMNFYQNLMQETCARFLYKFHERLSRALRSRCLRCLPIDELRLLVRSMMDRLLGLLSKDRLASDMSAVTLVIATLTQDHTHYQLSAISIHRISQWETWGFKFPPL